MLHGAQTDGNPAWYPFGSQISGEWGRLASASWDGTTRIWDASNGTVLASLDVHDNIQAAEDSMVYAVAWSPDGSHIAAGDDDGTVRLWDVSNVHALAVLTGHAESVHAVAWARDGRLASGSEDRTVRVWWLQ
jgi:WD40 repeat protein